MQSIEFKIFTEQDKNIWNDFICNSKWGDVLQIWQWGDNKRIENWEPLRVAVLEDNQILIVAQCLIKKLPIFGNYLYIPYGPVFKDIQSLKKGMSKFKEELILLAKQKNCVIIDIEPKVGKSEVEVSENLQQYVNEEVFNIFKQHGFSITKRNTQPLFKLFYNLDKSEEELLSLMKKNTRYDVRLAQKKGVVIKEYSFNDENIHKKIDVFYDMLLETQKRAHGYPIRSREYFHELVNSFKDTEYMSLFEGSFNGDIICMNISQRTGFWSSSFYASSNRLHTKVKAPHLMRWTAIQRAKESGCKVYDFWGIVPHSKQHEGYSDNKLSFGGERLDYNGIMSIETKPFGLFLFNVVLPLFNKIKSILHFTK